MESHISFKKFAIQTIVNPGTFRAIECGKETQNETNLNILQKDIKKFKHFEEISIGQIIAVKHENRYHRGLITDIYNRSLRPVYCVWLVDIGKNVETSADALFMIRTPEIRDKKLNVFEIVMYGIQPVTIELLVSCVNLDGNINGSNLDSILHKRESQNWSPAAFKFTKELFETNKCIYVNCVDIDGSKITGDIYYKQKGDDGILISLAQTLCDKDFAIFFPSSRKIVPLLGNQGSKYINSIERKIPNIPKNVEWEELSVKSQYRGTRNKFSSGNISSSLGSDKSSYSGSSKFLNSKDQTSPLGTVSFSPSWILKKMDQCSPSTSSGSFKSSCQNIEQTDKTLPSPKVSLLRIIQRNIQLYDMHK